MSLCGPVVPTFDELDLRIREKLEAEESRVYGNSQNATYILLRNVNVTSYYILCGH